MRPLTDADWPAFCDFAEKYFGMAHNRDRAFNEHWFKTARHDGWAGMVIDSPDGGIGGVMMAIVTPAWFAGRETKMAWISTGVVEPKLRARGAGAQLFMWIYRTFPLIGALSGNDFSNPMNTALGKTIPGVAIRRFVFVHTAAALDICRPTDRPQIAAVKFAARPPRSGLIARLVADFPEDYEALWARVREGLFWTTNRSADYRKWRYSDAPHMSYRLVEVRDDRSLRAFSVLRFQETPAGQVCRIVDFIAERGFATDAWSHILDIAREHGAILSDFFVIGSDQDEALTAAGFQLTAANSPLADIPHLLSPVEHRKWSNTVHFGGRATDSTSEWQSASSIYFCKADSDRDWPTPYDLARVTAQDERSVD